MILVSLAFASPAVGEAPSTDFVAPEWAGAADAERSEWLNFTSAFGGPGNGPDVEEAGGGMLVQTVPGAVVTGSGNIYNPGGVSVFELTDEASRSYRRVVLQVRAIGDLDVDGAVLEYGEAGGIRSLPGDATELARVSGGFGDTVLTRWEWDLGEAGPGSIVIRFAAASTHVSLAAVRLDALLASDGIDVVVEAPVHDRWNYLFNATPGTRRAASVFRSVEDGVGLFRHAGYALVFDLSEVLPEGVALDSVEVLSATLRVMTSSGFDAAYDPDVDGVLTHLPEGDERRIEDADPGRPVELLGLGFRNGFDIDSWTETVPYAPDPGSERTLYPAFPDGEGGLKDVTLAVDYTEPADEAVMAVGRMEGVAPGDAIPADTWMAFDVDLGNASVSAYVTEAVRRGRLGFMLTSLAASGGQGGARTFPEFHTADSLVGEPPRLELRLREVRGADGFVIRGIARVDGGIAIEFPAGDPEAVGIRWTSDLAAWTDVPDPVLDDVGGGYWRWTDTESGVGRRFYQVYAR